MKAVGNSATRLSERLLYTVDDARELLGGLARSYVYELLAQGVIGSVKVGRRRMIARADLEEYVERLRSGERRGLAVRNDGPLDRLVSAAREAVYDEIQEFVVATAFDTTVGQRIDQFITNRLIDLHAEVGDDPAPHTLSDPFTALDPVGPEDEDDGAAE